MKTVITSTGNSLESQLDSRFGRCSYFVVYDQASHSIEFLPNPYRDYVEGAGQASVQLVASRGASKIVSGEFGLKVKSLSDSLKIQLIVLNDPERKIKDIIQLLNHKR